MLRSKIWKRAGMVVMGLLLLNYWLIAIHSLSENKIFAYKTWWNAPMGTWNLLIVLFFATAFWIGWIWKQWR